MLLPCLCYGNVKFKDKFLFNGAIRLKNEHSQSLSLRERCNSPLTALEGGDGSLVEAHFQAPSLRTFKQEFLFLFCFQQKRKEQD